MSVDLFTLPLTGLNEETCPSSPPSSTQFFTELGPVSHRIGLSGLSRQRTGPSSLIKPVNG